MKRRKFLKSVFSAISLTALDVKTGKPFSERRKNQPQLYWGDLHCHCGISYGRGSLKDAFEAAQEQRLDFCAVVGHSSWHDTPRDPETLKRINNYIVYHDEGYEKLAKLWPDVKKQTRDVLKPGKFIPFLAFEWHSMKYGDHNVYYFEPEGEIVKANSIEELREKMSNKRAFVIPHHIAYLPGSRGIDWDHFVSSKQSPFVEVFSFHGCSISDKAPYPNLREMGPRSVEGTVETGLKMGHKFGFIASTDNHYGYPGSHGEGKVACYAKELTQESLWSAFKARRVYAVTGDRIVMEYSLNDAFMGEELESSGKRDIDVFIEAEDFIDYADVIKNGYILKRFSPHYEVLSVKSGTIRAKLRFEWGWGRKGEITEWEGTLKLSGGRIRSINPCFRTQELREEDWIHYVKETALFSRITEQNDTGCSFHSFSTGNPTPLNPLNNSLVLDVEMPVNASIRADVNGRHFEHTLSELLVGQRSHLIGGYLDVAVSFHRAVPEKAFTLNARNSDLKPEKETDYYYLCVRQMNNQWAWSSPIWVKA